MYIHQYFIKFELLLSPTLFYFYSSKDSHQLAIKKEQEYEKLRQSFNIQSDYKHGSAFDFELQEKNKFEKGAKKEIDKIERKQKLIDQKKLEKKKKKK